MTGPAIDPAVIVCVPEVANEPLQGAPPGPEPAALHAQTLLEVQLSTYTPPTWTVTALEDRVAAGGPAELAGVSRYARAFPVAMTVPLTTI